MAAVFGVLVGFALIFWCASAFYAIRHARAYWEWRELRDRKVGAGWHGPYIDRLVEFLSVPERGSEFYELRLRGRQSAVRMLLALAGAAGFGVCAAGVGLATDVLVAFHSSGG